MTNPDPVEMDTDERDAFLGDGGTGVISFSTGEECAPRSFPVSYGYDVIETTFYFRIAVGPESEKGNIEGRAVSFVVYGQDETDDWQSVIASGRLESTTNEDIATDTLEGLHRVDIPLVDIFGEPPRDIDFEFYRLVADEVSGRTESTTQLQ
jgi:nitroimidazol reductase NimA-like FMN-containing flavoprotein (pyridoxamine 5'-phosphate oxidase superfamily)